jgi:predicted ATPase/DNA-binding transcriptional regulator YiaG
MLRSELDRSAGASQLASARALRALREARGLSQDGWAAQLGVGARTVQRWETGAAVPHAAVEQALLTVCRAHGLLRMLGRCSSVGQPQTPEDLSEILAEARLRTPGRTPAAVGRSLAQSATLPAPLDSLIGREHDLAGVKRLLGANRLVTLTGAGGVGKTRLALQTATEVCDLYIDGIQWVELATLTDEGMVLQAVAAALGVHEWPDEPLIQSLQAALHSKHMLLVLDNCEHLVVSCARLAEEILRSCPHVRVLATSRERLRICGEAVWRVPSLTRPQADRRPPLADLAQYAAIRLFLERAAATQPGFQLTEQNADAISQICQRLDGIPLALELAAARVSALPVDHLAAQLRTCFRLLSGGSHTAPPRHQTIRATVEWSYRLLTESEQTVFRRLAVFVGGCTLAAAEAMCSGEQISTNEIVELLMRLVDRSLLMVADQGCEPRFLMLETIREFAFEQLAQTEETADRLRRHMEHFLALAEEAEQSLRGPDQAAWFLKLERDRENLRAALAWTCRQTDTPDLLLRMTAALYRFWWRRGHLSEGREWLGVCLERASSHTDSEEDEQTRLRARVLNGAAVLARAQGDYTKARSLFNESLVAFRVIGETWGIANTLHNLSRIAEIQGDTTEAQSLSDESLSAWRCVGDPWGIANGLTTQGHLAHVRGDDLTATSLYEEMLVLKRQAADTRGVALALGLIGLIAGDRGDIARATMLLEQSLVLFGELDDKWYMAWLLHNLACLNAAQGKNDRATGLFKQSFVLHPMVGIVQPRSTRGARPGPIRVLIADDHSAVRRGLRTFLQLDPELEVIGEAQDEWQALELAQRLQPDVLLTDLLDDLNDLLDGVVASDAIRKGLPQAEFIALTSVLEDDKVIAATRAAAIRYMLANTEADDLCEAIKGAVEGRIRRSPGGSVRGLR